MMAAIELPRKNLRIRRRIYPMRFTTTASIAMCLMMLSACADDKSTVASTATDANNAPERSIAAPTAAEDVSRKKAVSLGLDINDLSFEAVSTSKSTPPQQVLVYFDDYVGNLVGDVYVHVTLSGDAVTKSSKAVARLTIDADGNVTASPNATVSTLRDANGPRLVGTAIPIQPRSPGTLGTGKFWGTAVVRACLGDSTCAKGELPGSPRTISIAYDVDAVTNAAVAAPAEASVPLSNAVISARDEATVLATRQPE
jgi:hypothetical protein